ncbi:endonuclease III domain-containing protein [Desulfurococcus mucosus]|uniref:DNA-(Apurinic or apyrimidinic site) lyase n=1 Tax=Desulfurococcus mucosus (strain ATCC 35584 / DSM 2162 / JCM 9187 / O7/1) TaxID=765177 RepID=E8R967_DESM0|nr:endonuclease III [Desulfurococcus mucosus]ADV65043.1 DNA-(apurinic or apyrimidinic site) lyase [Desulfurococcus mucosus DSM 2162]
MRKTHRLEQGDFAVSEKHIETTSLFEVLVAVVLSQNTSDRNAVKAIARLREIGQGRITPQVILSMEQHMLEGILRPAGMYRNRARVLRKLAELFQEPGFTERLTAEVTRAGDVNEARRRLMELPGVGEKTADVVLLRYFGIPVFPVDTHISRITRRMGFTETGRYSDVSSFWMENTSPWNYLELHLYLITHGRRICKARKPLCDECVLRDLCKHYQQGRLSLY